MCLVLLYLLQRSRRNDRKALSSHGSNGSASPAKSLCRRRLCSLLILASIVGIAFISVTLPAYFLVRVWNLEISQFQELQLENSGEVASVFQEASFYADGFQNISSVDYMACCGAGHRLSKMADAYYLSKRLNFALRGYWGYCDTSDRTGSLTEVFHFLFGPQPISMPVMMYHQNSSIAPKTDSLTHHYARINNDVPGFHKLLRNGSHCHACHAEKAHNDVEFYADLRDRFQHHRSTVADFYKLHLRKNPTTVVIGMHIRAGNGESGDFAQRGRTIENVDVWLEHLTDLIVQASRDHHWNDAVLFLATDTPHLVDQLQALLLRKKQWNESGITVVHRNQIQPTEGSGVLFGQQGDVESTGDDCLRGWEDTLTDMILLSYADVVIAARPSSFTQSLPMSLVLATNSSTRRVAEAYCEVNADATKMTCFGNFSDWCCRGRTAFSLTQIQNYEYLRMPGDLFSAELNSDDLTLQRKLKLAKRPEQGCIPVPAGSKQICLPYDWSKFDVKPRPGLRFESP